MSADQLLIERYVVEGDATLWRDQEALERAANDLPSHILWIQLSLKRSIHSCYLAVITSATARLATL